ncbi:hypothetical protein COV17_01310 [Candidatus Woesearchaeota archaeon CG10_big_fil_rev_8_21_14_0_10_36_11]|nr:MAG: hypothetical protein COV17_01310 [Candidatus Woesearchaeota archaeon CG10_big_fil_rev_8_21_14_0_10_36_11]
MELQQEKPLYTLYQNKTRTIVPKFMSFIILGIVFYIGILLNIALLNLTGSEETLIKTIAFIFILLIITVGAYITFHRAHLPYIFYHNRILFNNKETFYTNISHVSTKKDIFDKIFKTYSLDVSHHMYIRHVPQSINIQSYVDQLVSYSKSKQ